MLLLAALVVSGTRRRYTQLFALNSTGRNACKCCRDSFVCVIKFVVVPCCSCCQWSQNKVCTVQSRVSAVQAGMTAMSWGQWLLCGEGRCCSLLLLWSVESGVVLSAKAGRNNCNLV
jgi:hypothetical protein